MKIGSRAGQLLVPPGRLPTAKGTLLSIFKGIQIESHEDGGREEYEIIPDMYFARSSSLRS